MIDVLLRFGNAMRDAGIPVSLSESTDAAAALRVTSLEDRENLRGALAATMVKSQAHRHTFDTLFDLYFNPRAHPGDDAAAPDGSQDDLAEALVEAVARGDAAGAGRIARAAVERFGRVSDSPTGTLYYAYPVFRALDPGLLMARVKARLQEVGGDGLAARVRSDEAEGAMAAFKEAVQADVRSRVAAQRGPEAVARYAVRALPEDVDLLSGSADEIEELRRSIRPLARKLASRVAMKRRRASRGNLDIRKTVRGALSTGGVPFDPAFKHRVPHRPELFVLCDISDSVGRFARFSLMLVHALSAEFARVRSFVFVDALDEVTRLFEEEDFVVAVERINNEAVAVAFDNHSDYGAALEAFWNTHSGDVGPRSTVIVLGDARNNNRATESWVLKELRTKARNVYWLNPEPKVMWDTGDSDAAEFADAADAMVEVRTLRQLEDFIASIA